jgi:hypothetical protein
MFKKTVLAQNFGLIKVNFGRFFLGQNFAQSGHPDAEAGTYLDICEHLKPGTQKACSKRKLS